jgi:putative fusobacterium outer membrane protein
MKQNKKLMLLAISLLALLSCTSNNGKGNLKTGIGGTIRNSGSGNGKGSGNPTVTNPTSPGSPANPANPNPTMPSISTNARFPKINLSAIPNSKLDIFAYKIAGEKLDAPKTASKTHYEVKDREVGFYLNRSATKPLTIAVQQQWM